MKEKLCSYSPVDRSLSSLPPPAIESPLCQGHSNFLIVQSVGHFSVPPPDLSAALVHADPPHLGTLLWHRQQYQPQLSPASFLPGHFGLSPTPAAGLVSSSFRIACAARKPVFSGLVHLCTVREAAHQAPGPAGPG